MFVRTFLLDILTCGNYIGIMKSQQDLKTVKMTINVPVNAASLLKHTSTKLQIKAGEGRRRLVSPGKIIGFLVNEYLDDGQIKRLNTELIGD